MKTLFGAVVGLFVCFGSVPAQGKPANGDALAKRWDRACRGAAAGSLCTRRWPVSAKNHCSTAPTALVLTKARRWKAQDSRVVAALAKTGNPRALQIHADEAVERFLRHKPLQGLDFKRRPTQAKKRFSGYLKKLVKSSKAAADRIEKVPASEAGYRAHRMLVLYGGFAKRMRAMEIPVDVRSGSYADDKRDAFCDAIWVHIEPLQKKAEKALEACKRAGAPWAQKCGALATDLRI